MSSKILIGNRGEIARRRRGGLGSTLRNAVAILLLAGAAGPATSAARTAAADAESVVSAFRDVCLRTRFDRGRAQAALEKLGWVRAGSARTDTGRGYNRVPLRAPGTVVLGPGIAMDYGYAKGPYARELTGR